MGCTELPVPPAFPLKFAVHPPVPDCLYQQSAEAEDMQRASPSVAVMEAWVRNEENLLGFMVL